MLELWHSFFASMLIWHTNSRVGARIIPLGKQPLSSTPCWNALEDCDVLTRVPVRFSVREGDAKPSSLSKVGGRESPSPPDSSAVVLDWDWDSEQLSKLPCLLTPTCPLSGINGADLATERELTTGNKNEKVFPEPWRKKENRRWDKID